MGVVLIRTLDLDGNYLNKIKSGDFFGWKVERLKLSNNSISHLSFLSFWGLEYHLETLDLANNLLTRVPSDALRLLINLQSLRLTGNRITSLKDNDFLFLSKLEVLFLDKNPVRTISSLAFSGTSLFLLVLDSVNLTHGLQGLPTRHMKLLRALSMANSNISTIPEGWTWGLPSLKSLNLDNNRISNISGTAFAGVQRHLRSLKLNNNKMTQLPVDALALLQNLKTLELRGNQITSIPNGAFNESTHLVELDLSNNYIDKIDDQAFAPLEYIEKIDLRANQLVLIEERVFDQWRDDYMVKSEIKEAGQQWKKRKIYLENNPWMCNCMLKWMKKVWRKKDKLSTQIPDLMLLRCNRPIYYEQKLITRMSMKDFTCDHDYYYYYYYY